MARCQIVPIGKPSVWKDDYGWNCDQTIECLSCGDIDMRRWAEDETWVAAMEFAEVASKLPQDAHNRPESDAQPTDGSLEVRR